MAQSCINDGEVPKTGNGGLSFLILKVSATLFSQKGDRLSGA